MKNRLRLLITIAAIFVMSMAFSAVSSFAADEEYHGVVVASGSCGENAEWVLDVEGTLTITGKGAIDSYTFDHRGYYSGGNYYDKGTTDAPWFDYRSDVKSLVIDEGIVTIGAYNFYEMTNLESVSLPSTLEAISAAAFYTCTSLTEVQIPDSVRLMGNGAFWNCTSLRNFVFPSSLKKISRHVIEATAITDLFIPANITEIEAEAIWNCPELTKIEVASDNNNYASYDDCLYNKGLSQLMVCPARKESIRLSAKVNSLGMNAYGGRFSAFYGCNQLSRIDFDENWKGTSMGFCWFSGLSSLKDIEIPEGVTLIDYMAFAGCSLENVVLPSTVTSLGRSCFGDMPSLKTLSIPSSVTSINFAAIDGSRPIIFCEKDSKAEEFAVDYGYNYRLYQIENPDPIYTGEPIEPEVIVTEPNSGTELVAGTDYELTYSNNLNAGKAVLKIACLGRYEGTAVASFNIKPAKAETLSVALTPESYTYNGHENTPNVTVKDGSETLKKDTDYTVSYASGRKNAGNYFVTITLKGNYTGTIKKEFTVKPANVTPTVSTSKTSVSYNGKAQTVPLTVKVGEIVLSDSEYDASFSNNINVGTASVIVTLKGNYTGTGKCTFAITKANQKAATENIDLPAIKISAPKVAKKAATVKWKKVSKANQKKIASIQIQYSLDKTFKTGVKTVTAKKSAVSKKIKKLTSKKTYYVRIRAYKKSGGKVHVSKWSKVKKVKIR